MQNRDGYAMDVCGPLPGAPDKEGRVMKYVFVIIDRYTRWVEWRCFESPPTSGDVIDAVTELVLDRYGLCTDIYCDRGSNFVSAETEAFADKYGIELKTGTSYQHTAAATAERVFHVFQKLIRCADAAEDWPQALISLVGLYHGLPNRDLGTSPHEALFGVPRRTGVDSAWGDEPGFQTSDQAFWEKRMARLSEIQQMIRECGDKSFHSDAKRLDARRNTSLQFEPGDAVYVRIERKTSKLEPRYWGKARIAEKMSNDNYKLEGITGGLHPIVHVSKLKRLSEQRTERGEEENEPKWLVEQLISIRGTGPQTECKVAWKGWPRSQASWVRADSLRADGLGEEVDELEHERDLKDLQKNKPPNNRKERLEASVHKETRAPDQHKTLRDNRAKERARNRDKREKVRKNSAGL